MNAQVNHVQRYVQTHMVHTTVSVSKDIEFQVMDIIAQVKYT